ncbi:MAG: hypothetical protein RR799_04635, partial [Lachnospiraceae bacterium]
TGVVGATGAVGAAGAVGATGVVGVAGVSIGAETGVVVTTGSVVTLETATDSSGKVSTVELTVSNKLSLMISDTGSFADWELSTIEMVESF